MTIAEAEFHESMVRGPQLNRVGKAGDHYSSKTVFSLVTRGIGGL